MCKEVSASFLTYSILSFVIIFTASLLNMIFSIANNPKDAKAFKEVKLTDYCSSFNEFFLEDLQFGKELSNQSYYNSTLEINRVCYKGTCKLESKSITTKNCSKACFEQSKVCFYGEKECLENKCEVAYWDYDVRECHEFNIIKKWRDTEMYKDSEKFKFIPYTQIKTKDEVCDKGYRRCGKVNEEEDFLCLKEDYSDFQCPINKIVILSNNNTPTDNYNYKKYKIGDKNIFYTNEKTDDYLIIDLFVDFDTDDDDDSNLQLIDKDSYLNFSKYNSITYGSSKGYPSKAKLNAVQYHSNLTVKEMKKYQEIFNKRSEMYSPEKIEEMNLNVKSNKNLLVGLGIAAFAYFAIIAFYFFPIYSVSCQCGNGCGGNCYGCLCYDITPMKRVITFYIVFFPLILFSFISFIITFSKIFVYKKYSSMEYIDEYKNYEKNRYSSYNEDELSYNFDNSIFYNYAQFINLLIIILVVIIYPIIIKKTSPKDDPYNEVMSYSLNEKKSKHAKKDYNNYNSKCMENITPGYDSNNFCPTTSDNYGATQPGHNNQYYNGETPYYQ